MRNDVGAVILAAGGSRRLGEPKQFLLWEGESLLRRTVRLVTEGGCVRVVVVVGGAAERSAEELRRTTARLVVNRAWERGLGTSVRSGVASLAENDASLGAIVLLVCDQPFLEREIIARLIQQWRTTQAEVVACRYAETLGVPALFDCACFLELLALPDDSGAKALLRRPGRTVAEVDFPEGAFDLDTPADLERARRRSER